MEAKSAKKEVSGEPVVVPSCCHERHKQMVVPKIISLEKTPQGWQCVKTTQWSDLQTDLLQEIMAELNLADQIRFRAVCKNWLSLPFDKESRLIPKLPWLLTFYWHGAYTQSKIQCKFFDPIHSKPYTSFGINNGDFEEDFIYRSLETETSKHGWVFFSMEKKETCHTSFILFSPFTREIMKLPDLYHGFQNKSYVPLKITFSSDPTSKECVFFSVFTDYAGSVMVGIYKHGYKNWTIKTFKCWLMSIESMVYFQGYLYCAVAMGTLLVYNAAIDQSWYKNDTLRSECETYNYIEYHLVESNGKILLVCINKHFDHCGIYAFDRLAWVWVAKTRLPNRALFIGRFNSISVPAFGEIKHIENKVFYHDPDRKKGKFYSLTDGQSHYCEGTEYEFLFKDKNCVKGIWIEFPANFGRQHCETIDEFSNIAA